MNSMTVYALGSELDKALAGALVRGVGRFPLGVTLHLDEAPVACVHILYHRKEPELLLSNDAMASADQTAEEMVLAKGRRIVSVHALGLDRVLIVKLGGGVEWGEGEDLLLRIDLTPASKPLSLYQGRSTRPVAVIGARRARKAAGPNEALPPKPISILALPEKPPAEIVSAESPEEISSSAPEHTRRWKGVKAAAALLAQSIGGLDPVLARALSRITEGDIDRLWPLLKEIAGRLAAGSWSWRLYDLDGGAGAWALYPIELPLEAPMKKQSDFLAALDTRGRELIIPSYAAHLRRTAAAELGRGLKRLERLKANLARDLADAERADEYRHFGNLLVTYRHLITPRMEKIVVRDFSGGEEVVIPLDPTRSPDRNIRLYFTKAKKGEKGKHLIRARRQEAEREITRTKKELERLALVEQPSDLLRLMPRERAADQPKRSEKEPTRFRRYVIDERHTAYVGRSDAENDLLTHRFASPSDLWFHAQGSAGSHVILKGAHPSTPRTVIEKAASIAAYFSKARHSSTVPVIYTEKRHVRKPRKSKAGTATCSRSKTVFVKPSLPDDAETQ
jgi:predicted ribosome quality control (RQC) complex YloA/Tae2 family protein